MIATAVVTSRSLPSVVEPGKVIIYYIRYIKAEEDVCLLVTKYPIGLDMVVMTSVLTRTSSRPRLMKLPL